MILNKLTLFMGLIFTSSHLIANVENPDTAFEAAKTKLSPENALILEQVFGNLQNKEQDKRSASENKKTKENEFLKRQNAKLLGVIEGILIAHSKNNNENSTSENTNKEADFIPSKHKGRFEDFYTGIIPVDIKEIVEYIKYPAIKNDYIQQGSQPIKGLLLHGPPGSGKTQLAKAISAELDGNFFSIKPSDISSPFFGVSEQKFKNLFKIAKEEAAKTGNPSIIYFDEFDALARKRSSSSIQNSNNSYINELLSQMDGFDARENVIVIASTNFKDNIDEAFLRPGRLDKKVYLGYPDKDSIENMFIVFLNKKGITFSNSFLKKKIAEFEKDQLTPAIMQFFTDELIRKKIHAKHNKIDANITNEEILSSIIQQYLDSNHKKIKSSRGMLNFFSDDIYRHRQA